MGCEPLWRRLGRDVAHGSRAFRAPSSLPSLVPGISLTGVFTRVEVAAWVRSTADAEAALVKRALAAGEVIRICRGLF